MKKGLVVFVSTLLVIILSASIFGMSIWSKRNHMVDLEELINAQYTTNQSNYDNMWKKIQESAQVSDKQAEHIKEIYAETISGRYNDSELLFKAIQEDNPDLDSSVYTELQRTIESGRNEFDNNQKKITDLIREYNSYVRKHVITSTIFNKKTMDSKDFIVTSERTNEAFNTGKDDKINIMGD